MATTSTADQDPRRVSLSPMVVPMTQDSEQQDSAGEDDSKINQNSKTNSTGTSDNVKEKATEENDNNQTNVRKVIDGSFERASKRLKIMYPQSDSNLSKILLTIQSSEMAVETAEVLTQLRVILEEEESKENTTWALVRSCGHADVIKAMIRYGESVPVLVEAMKVLQLLSCETRNCKMLDYKQSELMNEAVIALGALDIVAAASGKFPNNAQLAALVLDVVTNLITNYDYDTSFDLGFTEIAVTVMKRLPYDPSVLTPGCRVIYKIGKKHKTSSCRSRFEELQVLTFLATLLERFGGRERDLCKYAQDALALILCIPNKQQPPILSAQSDIDSDDE